MSQKEDQPQVLTNIVNAEPENDSKPHGDEVHVKSCFDENSKVSAGLPVTTETSILEGACADVTLKSFFLDKLNENIRESSVSEDSLSLEVNFGDSGSCRASDVSSISFQNIVLDDTDLDFEPYHTDQFDPSIKDSISESSDSPLHDFPCDDVENMCKNNFAEEIKLREHSAKSNCSCGEGCADIEIGCTCNDKTLKYVSKSVADSSYIDISNSSLAAYFAKPNPMLSSSNTLPTSTSGGGPTFLFTNTKNCCTDGARMHASFQGTVEKPQNLAGSGHPDVKMDSASSSDQHSFSSSDITVHDKPDSASDKDSQKSNELGRERNGLEIRNNVRDTREVKNLDNIQLNEPAKEGNHMTKIHRQSPGLAHRFPKDPDSSSSERELDTSEMENALKSGHTNNGDRCTSDKRVSSNVQRSSAIERQLKQSIVDNLRDLSPNKESSARHEQLTGVADTFVNFENALNKLVPVDEDKDVENEYDYVKYARIQDGDSYVGMRLAYALANESGHMEVSDADRTDEHFLGSSHENSPDKTGHICQKGISMIQIERMSHVNEESLTEIPLNGNYHLGVNEHNNFSLSPELTECDSAEAESVLSEEDKSTPSGMPNVEDGLSSSAGSDVEDMCNNTNNKCPSEMLKKKYKNDIEQELHQKLKETEVKEFFSTVLQNDENLEEPEPEHQETIRRKKEALDLAIKDIKTAIERSKFSAEKRPGETNDQQVGVQLDAHSDDEAVWVMREAYNTKLQHGDDVSKFQPSELSHEDESHTRETEQAYPMRIGKEEQKLESRPEGKPNQSQKGYDSGEEHLDSNQVSGNQRGHYWSKGYSSVPHEDAVEASYLRSQGGSTHKVYGPAMFFGSKKKVQTSSKPTASNRLHNESGSPAPASLNNRNTGRGGDNGSQKLEQGNFSNTLQNSRYRSNERIQYPAVQIDSDYLSDKESILQSYGVGHTSASIVPRLHGNNTATNSSQLTRDRSPGQHDGLQQFPPSAATAASLRSSHLGLSPTGRPQEDLSMATQYLDTSPSQYYQQSSHYQDDENPQRARHPAGPNQLPYDNQSQQQHQQRREAGTALESNQNKTNTNIIRQQGQTVVANTNAKDQAHDDRHGDSEAEDCEDEYYAGEPAVYIQKPKTDGDYDTDEETDELLDKQYLKDHKVDIPELSSPPTDQRKSRVREGEQESLSLRDPDNDTVLIEGVLFRAKYLGSTTLISEGQPSKSLRMMQAQEAVGRIKAPEGENQPSTDVDLFISTEKIMVLNTNLQEIMMDHSLRTISYIADIGDIIVVMARRGPVSPVEGAQRKHQSKICCHVFDSEEAQLIAQSIGQAFQVAYMEFLKANGIEDPAMMKEMDYQEVLNQQEIFGEELFLFSNKETQKEIIVPKMKNEALGIVVVESGWGSMVPTVVLANMSPTGPAARCGQLNIGDQIMSINGVSLVGLPLSSCINYIKASRTQTVVKLTVVSCAPVVEVCVKRPDVKYQLGFSVQNGVICSLLRGGIAERGGVRVGHRIIEINSQSVVAVAHEKIVNMLATAVGEIHMKTMPTSIYRLLTGQETPHYI